MNMNTLFSTHTPVHPASFDPGMYELITRQDVVTLGATLKLNLPMVAQLVLDGHMDALMGLTLRNPGGVRRLQDEMHFTYRCADEEVIFTDDLRIRVESAIGMPLEEVVYRRFASETALSIPESIADRFASIIYAMQFKLA